MAPLTSLQRPTTGPHPPVDPLFPFSLLWKRSQKHRCQSQDSQGGSQTKHSEENSSDAQSTFSKTETLYVEESVGKKEKEQS
ncbi:hypothetical protein N7456_006750 [Penicillium angulare]|uniref:Uncharacterized protein n=1 Tax=Penicillium angulare TaxID=116970 RepID=A0A9W9FIG8_9EURO|nr:hypothetical protein N7456_006750 [Penicillium angulare]